MINVTIDFDCHLNVAKKVVSNFKMNNLTFIVEGRAHSDHMKFHVIGFSKSVQFFEYDGYKVENLELAELMITHSMNRLLEEKVFGSDWPLFPKDYPHFIVE